ncbi:MAG TPA: hypothetical protein DHU85_08480 [Porphyromonadaceae bacterium]|nr:hypothetical protein [Porphyromonadaceae bacterium]
MKYKKEESTNLIGYTFLFLVLNNSIVSVIYAFFISLICEFFIQEKAFIRSHRHHRYSQNMYYIRLSKAMNRNLSNKSLSRNTTKRE